MEMNMGKKNGSHGIHLHKLSWTKKEEAWNIVVKSKLLPRLNRCVSNETYMNVYIMIFNNLL